MKTVLPNGLSVRLDEMVERNLRNLSALKGIPYEDFVAGCILKSDVAVKDIEKAFMRLLQETESYLIAQSNDLYGEAELPDFFQEVERLVSLAMKSRIPRGGTLEEEAEDATDHVTHLTMLNLFSEKYKEAAPELSKDLAMLHEARSQGYLNF